MMASERRWLNNFLRICLMLLVSLSMRADGVGAQQQAFDPGTQALRLYQRINGIVQEVLELERHLLFRLEKKRPIEWERPVSRLASARRQVRALRMMALRLEEKMPAGHPARAKIQSLKSQLKAAVAIHRKQGASIVKAGGEACRQALAGVDAACEDVTPASATVPFPVQTMDDQF